MLDNTDWQILLEYDKDPFQSYHALSKIIGVHHSTVADRISNMKEKNVLRPDGIYHDSTRNMSRPTSEVIGAYSPTSLGLERIHVLFKHIASSKDYELLFDFCDSHPYTHYIARLFGAGVTLYSQFDIPKGTFQLHKDTFKQLVREFATGSDLEIFRDPTEANAIPNYQKARNFEWDNSVNTIEELWVNFLEKRQFNPFSLPEEGKPFDNIDAELIRELTINGKTKITDLTDHFNLNKSTLSRRVSKIREHYISSARLVFGTSADKLLGFNNTQIVTGTFLKDSPLTGDLFLKFIQSDNIFPFDAFVTVDNNRFFLYTRASIGLAGDFMQFLYENTDVFELNQYQFYVRKSITYPFYHGNYDQDSGFRTDEEYIKNKELETLIKS